MIRLRGQEAYKQACSMTIKEGRHSNPATFFFENTDLMIPLLPEDALKRIKDGMLNLDNLACEVPSVWDLLLQEEKDGTLTVYPCQKTVLFFNRDFGPDLGNGVRVFGVLPPVFVNAMIWAMQSPVIEKEFDLDKFFLKLYPRMILKKGNWQNDSDLLSRSLEIAYELIRIFKLKSGKPWSLWGELLRNHPSLMSGEESMFQGGKMLDLVLDKIFEDLAGKVPASTKETA